MYSFKYNVYDKEIAIESLDNVWATRETGEEWSGFIII